MQPVSQLWLRRSIRSPEQERRFAAVASEYPAICSRLLGASAGSSSSPEGYDWSAFSRSVRRALDPEVPIGFLGMRVLRRTMVFGSRRGIAATIPRVAVVTTAFGAETAGQLLVEDYIGKPSLTNSRFRTSANRAHHAAHLARYTQVIGAPFWGAEHVVEWGGGYGNMARLVRRMSPGITYTIIDLPELLALQYVYLTAVEGKNPHVVAAADPFQLRPGRVNLVSSARVTASEPAIQCDAFLSTWAITESPPAAQQIVLDRNFFGASRILIAAKLDRNNVLAAQLPRDIAREPIGDEMRIGSDHEYWLR